MEKELKRVELTVDDLNGSLDRISLVSEPAIETDFFYFSKLKKESILKFSIDSEEKRVVTGVAMIPDMDILRFNDKTKEYYNVFFSKDTIYKCAELFFKSDDSAKNTSNIEHMLSVDDVTVFESWIVDTENGKGGGKNFEDIPDGSWLVSYKIDNDIVWEDFIKTGIIKGLSIEGVFTQNFNKIQKDNLLFLKEIKTLLDSDLSDEEIFNKIKQLKN